MRRCILFAISFLIFLSNSNVYLQSALAPSNKEEILKKARLEERNGISVLYLSGTPYEMGYQHGVLLKEKIRAIFNDYLLGFLNDKAQKRSVKPFQKESLLKYFRTHAQILNRYIPKEYQEELKGLAEGSGLSYDDVLLMHTFIDTMSLPKFCAKSEFKSCSNFIALGDATREKTLIHGRNLDWPGRGVLQKHVVVIFYKPDVGNSFVTFSWTGIIGALTGMNEKGITLGETGVGTAEASQKGIPTFFLLRQVLQYSDSLYDGIRIISSSPRIGGYTITLGDGRLNEACIIEFNAKKYEVRFPKEGVLVSVNHYQDTKLFETLRALHVGEKLEESSSWARLKRIEDLLRNNFGKIDNELTKDILRDHYNIVTKKEEPHNHTVCSKNTLHSVVFNPQRLTFLIAQGEVPAPHGEYIQFNLAEELQISVAEEKPINPFEFYSYEKKSFPYKLKLVEKASGYKHFTFNYPSIVETDYPEDIVYLDFYEPRGEDKYPAVVFLSHLAGGIPQIEGAFCRELASNGIAALLVQTAYQKNYRFSRAWLKKEIEKGVADEVVQLLRQLIIEAQRGIDWLENLPKIEKDRIGVMGISLGGIVVPVIAGLDDRIKSMAIILGGGDIGEIIWNSYTTKLYKKRLMEEGIRSARDLEKRWWMLDPLTFAFKAKAKPSMMINARFDLDIPRSSTLKLWRALEQPKISWLPTGHYTSIFTIGYAKIKTIQHFYANLVDKKKARKVGVDYTPGTPFERFRFSLEEIFGEKTKFNVSGRISEGIKRLKLGIIAKGLFNTPYFGGSEITGRIEKDERYRLEGVGGALLLGRQLSEHTRGYLKYSYETVKVHDVQIVAPSDFHRHIGRKGVSISSLVLERNTFDDSLYPIDGSYRALSAEVASKALGGDFNFVRTIGEASWYITTGYPKITFVFRVKGGWIGEFGDSEDVPFFERFEVGGSTTVRGYRSRLIGPKDSNGLPLWGEIMAVANAEARFPIYKRLNGAVFFDTGSVWEKFSAIDLSSDFKSSVGVGLRYRTNWAVLRLDYGYPLDRDPGAPRGRFHLALGLPF